LLLGRGKAPPLALATLTTLLAVRFAAAGFTAGLERGLPRFAALVFLALVLAFFAIGVLLDLKIQNAAIARAAAVAISFSMRFAD
jgi:hypothetical protein